MLTDGVIIAVLRRTRRVRMELAVARKIVREVVVVLVETSIMLLAVSALGVPQARQPALDDETGPAGGWAVPNATARIEIRERWSLEIEPPSW